jgi:ribonuclease E
VSAALEVAFEEASPEAAAQPAVVASSTQRETSAAEAEAAPAPHPDQAPVGELSASGRAVNDPRIAPSPVGEVQIETGRITLFSEQAAPPVELPDRNVPRASNDPRGPRATGTG